jgi:hypothetical protein
MNEKINLDLASLRFVLAKNKSFILPIVIMLVSVMLFFQFVIPQFNSLLQTHKDAKESLLKLEVLEENMNVLANIDEATLDSQLGVLNLALPLDKDFIGILSSIYSAAQKTGVSVGSFSFKVGSLSQSEKSSNFPTVELSIPVNAGIGAVSSFVEAIGKTFPLSQVSLIRAGNTSSTVNVSFYYMPIGSPDYGQDVRISPISQKGLDLINKLKGFEGASSGSQLPMPVATSSATQ